MDCIHRALGFVLECVDMCVYVCDGCVGLSNIRVFTMAETSRKQLLNKIPNNS